MLTDFQFHSVQSCPTLCNPIDTGFDNPFAHQASLSITNSWSLLKLMCIESMMPSYRLMKLFTVQPQAIIGLVILSLIFLGMIIIVTSVFTDSNLSCLGSAQKTRKIRH